MKDSWHGLVAQSVCGPFLAFYRRTQRQADFLEHDVQRPARGLVVLPLGLPYPAVDEIDLPSFETQDRAHAPTGDVGDCQDIAHRCFTSKGTERIPIFGPFGFVSNSELSNTRGRGNFAKSSNNGSKR